MPAIDAELEQLEAEIDELAGERDAIVCRIEKRQARREVLINFKTQLADDAPAPAPPVALRDPKPKPKQQKRAANLDYDALKAEALGILASTDEISTPMLVAKIGLKAHQAKELMVRLVADGSIVHARNQARTKIYVAAGSAVTKPQFDPSSVQKIPGKRQPLTGGDELEAALARVRNGEKKSPLPEEPTEPPSELEQRVTDFAQTVEYFSKTQVATRLDINEVVAGRIVNALVSRGVLVAMTGKLFRYATIQPPSSAPTPASSNNGSTALDLEDLKTKIVEELKPGCIRSPMRLANACQTSQVDVTKALDELVEDEVVNRLDARRYKIMEAS